MNELNLSSHQELYVQQVRELAELFGFETRNKYQVLDQNKQPLVFAAEQQKGLFGFLFRQFLGHWRKFDIHFMTPDRRVLFVAHHPFRFFFQRVEVRDSQGRFMGAIQMRFAIFTKRFDVHNERGQTIMEVASPLLKFWTFSFRRQNREVALVQKKWSGLFSEVFTDKDMFKIEYKDQSLSAPDRLLVLAASIFVDLLYFERKAD